MMRWKRLGAVCVLAVFASIGAVEAADAPRSPDVVVQWNRTLLSIVRTRGAQPTTIHPTRSFAIMHAAMYDAVNAIDRKHEPYAIAFARVPRHASQWAAAAVAAHDVLVALYPTFAAALDRDLEQSLAFVPDGTNKTDGASVGHTTAARMLALRSADGANAPPIPYVFGTAPGDYQSTPPNFPAQPVFTHWPHVTPFALKRADQFRPGPPPALASERYADAFNEAASMGTAGSTAATADESLAGRFWNGAIQNYWNEIAQTLSESRHLTTAANARLFALLNLTCADSVIAFYDAKYTYNRWRPVTAIREAGVDNNPDTIADPAWLPEVGNTPADPTYPGAHAVISAAAEEILTAVFDRNHVVFDVTAEALPGVTRSFSTLSAAAEEASFSRIFAGVHFRFDLTSGQRLGRSVADFVLDHFLTNRMSDRDDDPR